MCACLIALLSQSKPYPRILQSHYIKKQPCKKNIVFKFSKLLLHVFQYTTLKENNLSKLGIYFKTGDC